MPQLKLRKEIVVLAPLFLPSAFGGVSALPPDEKRRDPGHVVLSGKNCCVVTPDVMRQARRPARQPVFIADCLLFGEKGL